MLINWKVTIPQLTGEEERNAYVYLPDEENRYPVLYMFDGQNLFNDEEATYGKSWGLMDFLEENQVPLIIAAVECSHHSEEEECGGRLSEYTPFSFRDPYWGNIQARGKITMDWFVKEFKPYIDENFNTLPERKYTFISGSSMGGLMTLYALSAYNRYFSRGAALSPSLGFAPGKVKEMIRNARFRRGTHLYMDYGEKEADYGNTRKIFGDVTSLLIQKKVLVESRIVPKGEHNEASWERAVPFFMEVLFYNLDL